MGQILHRRATTTHRIRKEIKNSEGKISEIAERFGINWRTAKKWKERESVQDAPMGNGRSNSVLTKEDEWLILETRTKTWLPLDDLLSLLLPAIPKLTRSNLHRYLKSQGVSQLPEELKPPKREAGKFRSYEIGFLHIDITEFWLEKKKWHLFVAIDRVTKMAYAEIFLHKTVEDAVLFLDHVFVFFPYKIHRILTDNGLQFTYRSLPAEKRPRLKRHPFQKKCMENGTKFKLTKFRSPQTNGQVEKMNDIIKKATLKFFRYETIDEFSVHLAKFLNYYNCVKKLKSLNFKSPYGFIIEKHKEKPKLFIRNPLHNCVGLDS